jgi:hypothetical protein
MALAIGEPGRCKSAFFVVTGSFCPVTIVRIFRAAQVVFPDDDGNAKAHRLCRPLQRPIPYCSRNTLSQPLSQFITTAPFNMIVLPRIKVDKA